MFKRIRLKRPLAVLDTESTGLDPQTARIVEIAAIRFAPTEKTACFTRRINPTVHVPEEATKVHGIRDDDLADCPTFADVARRLARFLDGCDLAGFNIKRFDLPLLIAEFRRAGVAFPLSGRAVLDAFQLFCDRERRDLAAAYRFYCGKPHDYAHSAEHDARATAQVLDAQLSRYRDLPRTVPELHRQLTEVDLGGWFRCRDGTIVFAVGKYAGRPLTEVIERHPDYIRWLLSLALLEDTRHIIVTAMNGQADD